MTDDEARRVGAEALGVLGYIAGRSAYAPGLDDRETLAWIDERIAAFLDEYGPVFLPKENG